MTEPDGPFLMSPVLITLAEMVEDLERVRIATDNRLRALTTVYGLDASQPVVRAVTEQAGRLAGEEQAATRTLERVMREHPLGAAIGSTVGVGFKQAARLLAVIGDPYWNTAKDAPRTVSQLWAYCGYSVLHPDRHPADHRWLGTQEGNVGGVAPTHRKGVQGNWNDKARMRCYLIAAQCIRHHNSPYREVYDDARAKYAEAVHAVPCPRCGPKGKPALPGSPLSPGHQHARAVRAIAKELLRDLWREAKRLHEQQMAATLDATPRKQPLPSAQTPDDGQSQSDIQTPPAVVRPTEGDSDDA